MKGSLVRKYGMVGLGVLLLGWLVMVFFFSDEKPKILDDPTHCKVCNRELPPQFQGTGDCPYCLGQGKGAKAKRGGGGSTKGPNYVFPAVIFGLFLGLAGTHVFLTLRARKRVVNPEDDLWVFRCPKCERKLRYRSRQAGHYGRCPTCRKVVLFPVCT